MNCKEEKMREYGSVLKKVFRLPEDVDSLQLMKGICRLERKLHRASEWYCNGWMDDKKYLKVKGEIALGLAKLGIDFGNIIFNADPRGASLKLDINYTQYLRKEGIMVDVDWGGDGILAPDFH